MGAIIDIPNRWECWEKGKLSKSANQSANMVYGPAKTGRQEKVLNLSMARKLIFTSFLSVLRIMRCLPQVMEMEREYPTRIGSADTILPAFSILFGLPSFLVKLKGVSSVQEASNSEELKGPRGR